MSFTVQIALLRELNLKQLTKGKSFLSQWGGEHQGLESGASGSEQDADPLVVQSNVVY